MKAPRLLLFLLVFSFSCSDRITEDLPDSALDRQEWEKLRQMDPSTGEIPAGMRAKELTFAERFEATSAARSGNYNFKHKGPYNVGGRTRAFAMDVSNEEVLLAGGVSGGMWRSTDNGSSWLLTTSAEDHHSVTCLKQDLRRGKEHIWYYGSGEGRGNSASGIFGATYLGTGIWQSVDSGKTWTNLNSTNSGTPEITDAWDIIWNIALDATDTVNDVIMAATRGQIQRSVDAGQQWDMVLGDGSSTSVYTDVLVNSLGDYYASMSTGGSDEGIWRSPDGENWTRIDSTPFPQTFRRMVMAEDPNRPNTIYFLGESVGTGTWADTNGRERNSLLRYTYLSGDGTGTGGKWENLSENMPYDTSFARVFRSQGGYNLVVAVQPGDSNRVIIGGTNLFMSTEAFNSDSNITQIGGYNPEGDVPFSYRWVNHHPDQHVVFFKPSDPNVMYNGNDGGVYRLDDVRDSSIEWIDLNKGYVTTQFYTVGIDHGTRGSELVFGGLQDNGTQFTKGGSFESDWVSPNLGDGSYCAAEDGGEFFYFSRQNARIIKAKLDQNGELLEYKRIDPEGASSYLFINPFILDRNDDKTMFLSEYNRIWRNSKLDEFPLDSIYEKTDSNWERFTSMANTYITAFSSSYDNPKHRLYYGTSNKAIYRIEDSRESNLNAIGITGNILTGGWTSSISIDPRDADKVLVTYSNYRVHSVYYSENGGATWLPTAGNLEDEQPVGSPPGLGLGDGPSVRASAIVPTISGTRYFVGTSIGLFSTDELKGDSTIWVQEAENSIGNAVVDMIDYRETDGFMAIATHGKGVYTTFILDALDMSSVNEKNKRLAKLWPIPASDEVNVSLPVAAEVELNIFDLQGRHIRSIPGQGMQSSLNFAVSDLPSGNYLLRIKLNDKVEIHKFTVR